MIRKNAQNLCRMRNDAEECSKCVPHEEWCRLQIQNVYNQEVAVIGVIYIMVMDKFYFESSNIKDRPNIKQSGKRFATASTYEYTQVAVLLWRGDGHRKLVTRCCVTQGLVLFPLSPN